MAKSMAAKWLPIAGAVAMATWSKYSTHQIGNKAIEVFSRSIEFENDEMLEINTPDLAIEDTDLSGSISKDKDSNLNQSNENRWSYR